MTHDRLDLAEHLTRWPAYLHVLADAAPVLAALVCAALVCAWSLARPYRALRNALRPSPRRLRPDGRDGEGDG